MPRMRRLALVAITLIFSNPLLAQDETSLRATNGLDSQKYMGIGKGVIVTLLNDIGERYMSTGLWT